MTHLRTALAMFGIALLTRHATEGQTSSEAWAWPKTFWHAPA
jgi:hypothetical protein